MHNLLYTAIDQHLPPSQVLDSRSIELEAHSTRQQVTSSRDKVDDRSIGGPRPKATRAKVLVMIHIRPCLVTL